MRRKKFLVQIKYMFEHLKIEIQIDLLARELKKVSFFRNMFFITTYSKINS